MGTRSSAPFIPTERELTLVDATSLEVRLARHSREHLFRIDPTTPVAYRWSQSQAVVDAGDGFPMAAGESLTFDDDILGTRIYIRQASGGDVTLHHAFMRPSGGV